MVFDAIVIGSGFGGAVSACRLAEAGYRVLVLERGRRWDPGNYPREPGDPWIWDASCPQHLNGWLDFRMFDRMAVAQGAGVGGGSLIYANIFCEAPPAAIDNGWTPEINYRELKPHYDTAGQMLNVQHVPANQWPARTRLMQEAARSIDAGDRFQTLPLAVSFDPEWSYDLEDPRNHAHSKRFTNEHGVEQGTCIHLGECDIGCPVKAKNTLDLNYLARAEQQGAEIRADHLVTDIEPVGRGYRVHFDRLERGERRPGSEDARLVIVAAGSLGSTELLLRCRDATGSLPRLSERLGQGWCSNGDFLTLGLYPDGRKVSPTWGPTITSSIDFLDRSRNGHSYWIEDGGFPDLLERYFHRFADHPPRGYLARLLLDTIRGILRQNDPFGTTMPWFAQGVDDPGGTLSLRRKWWFFGPHYLDMDHDPAAAREVVDEIIETHRELSEATGGELFVPPTWTYGQYLVTPHPLGGCNIGRTAEEGVVNHLGEAFGHPNLYVLDGAIVPRAIGVNPSRTIAALAERNVRALIERDSGTG